MKVAIYHNILWSKYKGAVLGKIPQAARERGHEFSFVQIAETESNRQDLSEVDLSYHTYPYRLLFKGSLDDVGTLRRAAALVADVVRQRADLVLLPGYDRPEYWAMLMACMVLRIPRAVFCDSTARDRPRGGLKESAKAFFFRHCDGYFCYGQRAREYLLSYGIRGERIIYRRQAAALPRDYSVDKVLAAREAASREPPTNQFLYVGRLSPEKGLQDLLDAMRLLADKGVDVSLALAGSGPDASRLQEQAKRLGLAGRVEFLGARSLEQLGELYLRATALVLPSHSEPWGLVVNEALSYGCPVVVSDACGCVPELVLEGTTGHSFETGNPDALARAIEKSLAMNARSLAVARDCIELISGYSPKNSATQIVEGCERLLGDSK